MLQAPQRVQTFAKPSRQLKGTQVYVRREGRLFIKQSFMRPKRPCNLHINGSTLTLTTFYPHQNVNTYNLEGAKLDVQGATLRLTLSLKNGQVFVFLAETKNDFKDWRDTLLDVIHWGFHRFYELSDQIGHGAFATVRKAYHRISGEVFAVKIIDKSRRTDSELNYFQREVNIVLMLKHLNIVRVVDLFQSDTTLYIVTEYVPGGTLKTFVEKHGPVDEDTARAIMTDILNALKYIHSKGVVHRDLKPENLLCTNANMPMRVKLIDFGLGRQIPLDFALSHESSSEASEDEGLGPDGLMTTPVGTPHFVAPEVLSSLPYGKEVDLFSCGVILYWLLSTNLPFDDPDYMKLVESIKRTEIDFSDPVWNSVSPDARDLIQALLDRSPIARLSAAVALGHPWFSHEHCDRDGNFESPVPGDEILVRQWKADPAFEVVNVDTACLSKITGTCVGGPISGFNWSLTSPLSPRRKEDAENNFQDIQLT